jgi:uncharacterized protein (DUF2141 family)
MNFRFLTGLIAIVITCFVIAATQPGCANIVPPMGGPKDTLPPVLINVTPADSTLAFDGKKVVLTFNEYVQVDNIQKNLLVNPTPKIPPTVEQRLKTITVTLRDTLEENTTYSINFGRAIKDLNEGNNFGNYSYLFSTGRSIDSLRLGGNVVVAETGKADSTLIVLLYTNHDDSAIIKDRSRYITRVDSNGNFRFANLAGGTYSIYALKDEGARRYLSKDQLFAFSDSLVSSESQKMDIRLYAFVEQDTTRQPAADGDGPAPAASRKRGNDNAVKALKLQTNASGGELDLLSNLEISFSNSPLKSFDSTKVILTDTAYQPLTGYRFKTDTSNEKVTVIYPWTESTPYKLIVDSTAAEDTAGTTLLRSDTLDFVTKSKGDYGLVRLRFLGLDLSTNPVLQFVQGGSVKSSHVFTNNQFYAELFAPGEYELRIFLDENRNGTWDTGQFFKDKRQPERVLPIQRKINVRPNWDTEVDIQL